MHRYHFIRWATAVVVLLLNYGGSRAAEDALPASAIQADLRLALRTIEEAHPDLSHSASRADVRRIARKLEEELDRAMTQSQAWAKLAQINPVLADAHLFIGLPNWRDEWRRADAGGYGFFPFEVIVDARGSLLIAAALGGGPTPWAGRRIQRIGGRDAKLVAQDLLTRVHGDTEAFRAALLSRRWWLFHSKVYGNAASFELELDGIGALRVPASSAVPAILQDEMSFERTFRCNVSARGAVLTLSSFAWPDKSRFFAFTHGCFSQISASGTNRLVIDIRQNGGGDDDMWRDGILRYIADRPYKHGSRYIKRLREASGDGEVRGGLVSGAIETAATPPDQEPLKFKGKVYVLIGTQTYSSAVLFSNVVKDYGFATLAGVGGAVRTRQSGGVQTLLLPRTGLMLFYPRFVLERPSGVATPSYLEPDLTIEDDPLDRERAVEVLLRL